jgi:hypothetical protein
MPEQETIPELVNKLWELGNLIAGFAAVQSIAFGFITLQPEWKKKVHDTYPYVIIIVTALIFFGVSLQRQRHYVRTNPIALWSRCLTFAE